MFKIKACFSLCSKLSFSFFSLCMQGIQRCKIKKPCTACKAFILSGWPDLNRRLSRLRRDALIAAKVTAYSLSRSSRKRFAPRFLIFFSSSIALALEGHCLSNTLFHGIPGLVDLVSPLLCSISLSSRSSVCPV